MTKNKKKNGLDTDSSVVEDSIVEDKEDIQSSDENENLETLSYEELFDKSEDLEKALLRANADLDNAIKRTRAEVEKAHKYGVEKLLHDLLPVIDNLEHAILNLSTDVSKEDKEGIELTLKSFESTLDKFGMIPIYPVNEEFNPEKHEAVSMEANKDKKDGEIGNIFQRGWELHSRVLRPARVTVIKN
tara:strand:- start:54 stop:617 length:564 start_codon:yes stop_codon:yes gene_type:complete